jgi:uncharacterized membrane protein YkvA (DUF1232 family)
MSEKTKQISPAGIGVFQEIYFRIRLILRLMRDRRVSALLKVIPVAALAYLVWPIDIPGPIDDAGVLWLGSSIFIDLCPPDVVAEHMTALGRGLDRADENIIDAEFKDK